MDLAVALLGLATPGILALQKFDWSIDLLPYPVVYILNVKKLHKILNFDLCENPKSN